MSEPSKKAADAFASVQPENVRRRRIISILSLTVILIIFGLIAYFVGNPLVQKYQASPEEFRDHVRSYGAWGPLLMIGLRALQVVVAIIPGEVLEVASGFIFGWFWGMILCLTGTTLAVILIYWAVRKWGVRLVEAFFPREKILKYSFIQNEKKLNMLVFMLFLIPGTPKDLLDYLVGLTPMKLSTFLLITTFARIPSVVSSTIVGSLAQKGNVVVAAVIYGVTILISIFCVIWYRRTYIREKQEKARGADKPQEEKEHV